MKSSASELGLKFFGFLCVRSPKSLALNLPVKVDRVNYTVKTEQ